MTPSLADAVDVAGARHYSSAVIHPRDLYEGLAALGVRFYAGVPDSLLKDFCAYVTANSPADQHVITANEGGAIALAMGYHLATCGVPLVYMQNSGLGNTINPLTSLASAAVYGIPMVLLIGWRGEPGVKDEPQHVQMGAVSAATLDAIEVPHQVLPADKAAALACIEAVTRDAQAAAAPRALLVRKGTFEKFSLDAETPRYPMSREAAIEALVEQLPSDAIVVSTTGKPSRELYELREARSQPHDGDLLTVGGMGHASQIALGIALQRQERETYCLDGDGAVLMHLGGLSSIAALAPPTFRHVVLNNGAHDSVGGQPTLGFAVDICKIAEACGYAHTESVDDAVALPAAITRLQQARGPALLEVRIHKGARSDLGRPKIAPKDLKAMFMAHIAAEPVG